MPSDRAFQLPLGSTIFLGLAVLAIAITGCSGRSLPELVPVKGCVKLNGEPLKGAFVLFRPKNGGRRSRAVTRADGTYELKYLHDTMGATLGEHTVSISVIAEGAPNEPVPAKYNKASQLTATIEPDGEKSIDFDLKN